MRVPKTSVSDTGPYGESLEPEQANVVDWNDSHNLTLTVHMFNTYEEKKIKASSEIGRGGAPRGAHKLPLAGIEPALAAPAAANTEKLTPETKRLLTQL
ncbi:jg17736 [Pararge aegeria aegeria]|uniref:Jg17736 protein n=1 Tax=Pararge aegeria aegeria TaxID=348720 RepID=A0A8S4S3I9_9NEOP|nr:jg17736 [Pararge aegeria aegeria]